MNRKSVMILLVALICGLVAMYGANQILSSSKRAPEMVKVLVAARDLKEEEVLRPEMVRVEERPKTELRGEVFTAPGEVDGRWLTKDVDLGEPIRPSKLGPKNSPPSLVSRIGAGLRAVAIEVNEQTGVSGFIFPGHRVDILIQPDRAEVESPRSHTILENVKVLAAGQATTRPEDKSIQVRSVTVEVTPEDAEMLSGAKMKGPLTLTLRGLDSPTTPAEAPRMRPKAETRKVLVARHAVAEGVLLGESDVELVDMPVALAPQNAFDNLEAAIGRTLQAPLEPREAVLAGKFVERARRKEATVVQPLVSIVVARTWIEPDRPIRPESVEVRQVTQANYEQILTMGEPFTRVGELLGWYTRSDLGSSGGIARDAAILRSHVRPGPPLAERAGAWSGPPTAIPAEPPPGPDPRARQAEFRLTRMRAPDEGDAGYTSAPPLRGMRILTVQAEIVGDRMASLRPGDRIDLYALPRAAGATPGGTNVTINTSALGQTAAAPEVVSGGGGDDLFMPLCQDAVILEFERGRPDGGAGGAGGVLSDGPAAKAGGGAEPAPDAPDAPAGATKSKSGQGGDRLRLNAPDRAGVGPGDSVIRVTLLVSWEDLASLRQRSPAGPYQLVLRDPRDHTRVSPRQRTVIYHGLRSNPRDPVERKTTYGLR